MTDDEIDRLIRQSEETLHHFANVQHLTRAAIEKFLNTVGPEHKLRRAAMQSLVDGPKAQADFIINFAPA